jgi:hypothetical protein
MIPLTAPSDEMITRSEMADAQPEPAAASVASYAIRVEDSTRSKGRTSRYAAFSAR